MRVYLPLSARGLREARDRGAVGPAPLAGHAVTAAVVSALPDSEDEEREYAVLTAAAVGCLDLIGDDDVPLRVVVAVDVDGVDVAAAPAGSEDMPSLVSLSREVPWRRVAALLVDSADAGPSVAAAHSARGDEVAEERAVEALLEHELGWFGVQEVDEVLEALGG